MHVVPVLLALACMPAFAQLGRQWGGAAAGPQTGWIFGIQRVQPKLTARVEGSRDGKLSLVDSGADLGLGQSGTPLGYLGEYQGQSQAFQVSYESASYAGQRNLPRTILLDGTSYPAGADLQSTAKVSLLEGLWTYKFIRRSDAWIGFDLGAQVYRTDLKAVSAALPATQQTNPSWVVPQIGLTAWSSGVEGLLESRFYLRYFTHKGATLTRYGMDARAYLYPGFGLRAFFEDSRMHIPTGSLQQALEVRAERRVTGMGLVVRF